MEERDTCLLTIKKLEQFEEKEDETQDVVNIVRDFTKKKTITRTMLVTLVDKVLVSQDKNITIVYKFSSLNLSKDEKEIVALKAI